MEKKLMSTDGLDYLFSAYDGEKIVNGTAFSRASRGIYVGGDGHIIAIMESGTRLPFYNAVAGSILQLRATKIASSASTTATNLIALV